MENSSTRSVAIKYGIILGLLCSLLIAAIYIGRLNQYLGLIGIALTIVMCYLAIQEYKGENEGYMTLGKGVGMCAIMGIIAGVISGVFDFVYTSFVDPGILEAMIDEQMDKMAENPAMTDEAIEQAKEMAKNFSTPTIRLVSGLFNGLIGGAFWGLITSAIMKNDPPE